MPHSYEVITNIADWQQYVALKHLVQIQGYNTKIFLPKRNTYDPATRTGSVYNSKDHEYCYNDEPDFIARIAYTDPQEDMFDHGTVMDVDYVNIAYTLKNNMKYCPGEIAQFSKLYVNHGGHDLSYFVREISVLRNPNAKSPEAESLIRLELVLHV